MWQGRKGGPGSEKTWTRGKAFEGRTGQECFLGAEQGGSVPGGGKGMGKVSCWVMQKRGQGLQPASVLQAVLDSWEGSESAREEVGNRKVLLVLFVLFLVVAAILLVDHTWWCLGLFLALSSRIMFRILPG